MGRRTRGAPHNRANTELVLYLLAPLTINGTNFLSAHWLMKNAGHYALLDWRMQYFYQKNYCCQFFGDLVIYKFPLQTIFRGVLGYHQIIYSRTPNSRPN